MNVGTIDQQYATLRSEVDAFNTTQTNPANLPIGFHKVVTSRGEDAGMGFYCNDCKLHVVAHAPSEVRHCRRVSFAPTGWFARLRMKTRRLEYFRSRS
jgi:hypothetical protein